MPQEPQGPLSSRRIDVSGNSPSHCRHPRIGGTGPLTVEDPKANPFSALEYCVLVSLGFRQFVFAIPFYKSSLRRRYLFIVSAACAWPPTMDPNNYTRLSNFDVSHWAQMPFEPFPDDFPFDSNSYHAFFQTQPEFILDDHPVRSWDNSLQVPFHWGDTPTVTDLSSTNTQLSLSDQSSSDNDVSRQIPSESKRKLPLIDQTPLNKRQKSVHGRTHTKENRRTGACLSCQMKTNKHGCIPGPDPAGPCLACLRRGNALSLVPCRKARFQDVRIIRLGPSKDIAETLKWLKTPQDHQKAEWKRLTNLSGKKSPQTSQSYIELRLSQGHSTNTLNLRVQEFDPVESDKTSYPWYDNGVEHFYRCPNYAIADRDHATDQFRRFMDSNVEQYIDHLLPRSTDAGAMFTRMVFRTARAHESSLVKLALRFWVAGRFIEDPWTIHGQETLGMKFDPLSASPYSRSIPVTPIMNFQIDNIVIYDHLTRMLDDIRTAMKAKILPRKKEDWFEIHLATFILLHHVDLTLKHDIDFALLRNMSTRFSNRPLVEMVTFSTNALLTFHQQEKGHFPLSAPWADVQTNQSFSDDQKGYLLEARRLIQQIDVPHNAGDDLFWTSQIYDSAWQPKFVEVR